MLSELGCFQLAKNCINSLVSFVGMPGRVNGITSYSAGGGRVGEAGQRVNTILNNRII